MIVSRKHRLRSALWIACALGAVVTIALTAPPVRAVDAPRAPTQPIAASNPARPYWIELPTAQREALAPLADDWEYLDSQTKKKWVEIANRYPKMSPDERSRTQQRMREWARLTPEQRRVARDSYGRVRAMNAEQRADMLRRYQALPPEKRKALTTQGQASKAIVVPKPAPPAVARRVQLREGAKVRNPALAAQKSAVPLVAPARPAAKPPETAPAALPPAPTP
jgi:hypothetical protein